MRFDIAVGTAIVFVEICTRRSDIAVGTAIVFVKICTRRSDISLNSYCFRPDLYYFFARSV